MNSLPKLLILCLIVGLTISCKSDTPSTGTEKEELAEQPKKKNKGKKKRNQERAQSVAPAEAPTAPDTYPLYPGCTESDYVVKKKCAEQKLIADLIKVIKYPSKAKDDKVNGTVLHSFVIEADGTMSNLELVKTLTPECDAAAYNAIVDLMELSGPWEPGTLQGKKVAAKYSLPIQFKN